MVGKQGIGIGFIVIHYPYIRTIKKTICPSVVYIVTFSNMCMPQLVLEHVADVNLI